MRADLNHYRVLGVSRNANSEQIRAAYVALVKRYHPDSSGQPAKRQNGVHVQRIVAAYNTLKDPTKRAAYDAQLRQQAQRARPAAVAYVAPKRKRKKLRLALDRSLLIYAAAAVAAAAGIQFLVSGFGKAPHGRSGGTEAVRKVVRDLEEVPSPARIEPVARQAGMLSGGDATSYSARCFAQASRSRNPTAADLCIAFDTAYIYWRETASGAYVAEPYFQPDRIRSRDIVAYAKLDPDAAMVRVASVRAATFEALLRVASDVERAAEGADSNDSSTQELAVGPPPEAAHAPTNTTLLP